MNIPLILAAMALYTNAPTHYEHTYTHSPLYGSYSSLNFPDPSPFLEIQLEPLSPSTSPPKTPNSTARITYKFPTATENKVARTFAPPNVKWSAGHRGVDISLEAGSEVLAAGDGVVIYAGKLNDRSLISIEHADGIRTTYEPVSPSVTKGDKVSAGQVIGTLDEGHCGPKSCLHWGAKHGKDNYIDPLSLLRNRQIRLIE